MKETKITKTIVMEVEDYTEAIREEMEKCHAISKATAVTKNAVTAEADSVEEQIVAYLTALLMPYDTNDMRKYIGNNWIGWASCCRMQFTQEGIEMRFEITEHLSEYKYRFALAHGVGHLYGSTKPLSAEYTAKLARNWHWLKGQINHALTDRAEKREAAKQQALNNETDKLNVLKNFRI